MFTIPKILSLPLSIANAICCILMFAYFQLYIPAIIVGLIFLTYYVLRDHYHLFQDNVQLVKSKAIGVHEIVPKALLKNNRISVESERSAKSKASKIKNILASFAIEIKLESIKRTPRVTSYYFSFANSKLGTKTSNGKITTIRSRLDDIKLAIGTSKLNFIPVVEGTNTFGFEAIAPSKSNIGLTNVLDSNQWGKFLTKNSENILPIALGTDLNSEALFFNLATAPHVLIAGATNSGKTSCLHSMLISLLMYHSPDTLKLILVDGKKTEFAAYENLPHLAKPLIYNFENTVQMLNEAMNEVERRNELFRIAKKRDILSYNASAKEKLPFVIIAIDEYAEITMQTSRKANLRFSEFENKIIRIGQLARSAGIHLILSTQRPDAEIITPALKANIPTKICFAVTDKTNSMVVLDKTGAENLTGKGDGYYYNSGTITRFQCAYVTDHEISTIVKWWKNNATNWQDSRTI